MSSSHRAAPPPNDGETGHAGELEIVRDERESSHERICSNHAVVEFSHVPIEKNPPTRGSQGRELEIARGADPIDSLAENALRHGGTQASSESGVHKLPQGDLGYEQRASPCLGLVEYMPRFSGQSSLEVVRSGRGIHDSVGQSRPSFRRARMSFSIPSTSSCPRSTPLSERRP